MSLITTILIEMEDIGVDEKRDRACACFLQMIQSEFFKVGSERLNKSITNYARC